MDESANPLLLSWVSEWLETARERNSKGVTVYKKAYDSLRSCPLAFTHPSEAQQLTGFGPKLCDRLTDKMKIYCAEHGLPMPQRPEKQRKRAGTHDDGSEMPAKKPRKPKPYVPALRSGAYGLVLALSTLDENASSGITKTQIIELAQPHSDSSFTAPSDPTKFYTAWNSMKTLIEKDLVYEKGRPSKKYALTEEGWEVARRIKSSVGADQQRLNSFSVAEKQSTDKRHDSFTPFVSTPPRPNQPPPVESPSKLAPNAPDVIPAGDAISSLSDLPTFPPIVLEPGSFTVELVLDVREVRAKQDRDYMQNELCKAGVKPIMRALEVGDILWVARLHSASLLSQHGAEGDEVMLDWIVERKRLDDLVGSIKDGRFHEQKFRLRKSRVKNVIYIIEEISMNADHFQKYEEAVESAVASTQVVNGYFVKKTKKMDDTIRYLTRMTLLLKELYEKKPLHVIPTNVITLQNYAPLLDHLKKAQAGTDFHITYSAFASLSSKSESLTLRDVYLKMLMCIRGITGEKALEIQKRWKTPNAFLEAYKKCDEQGGGGEQGRKRKMDLVSSELGNLVGRKKIAKTLSVKIFEVWGDVKA